MSVPAGFDRTHPLCGFGRPSPKPVGLKLRKIIADDGRTDRLRPGLIAVYMAGLADEWAYPLLLAVQDVPALAVEGWLRPWRNLPASPVQSAGSKRPGRRHRPRPVPAALHVAADDHQIDRAGRTGDVASGYAPGTVNADGWAATRNAFLSPSPTIAVIPCSLEGFLKVRDRCRKARELHRRAWDVYHAAAVEECRRLADGFGSP